MKMGDDEEPFYDGKLISSGRTNIINERRYEYGFMIYDRKQWHSFEKFRKEEEK